MNGDTPDVSEEVEIPTQDAGDTDETNEAFTRPPIGAVRPIRDPEDEPFAFRFEVGPAILTQLLEKLRRLEERPLIESLGARHPGFYQLFLDGQPRYIGKTSRPIGTRLAEHERKLRGRLALHRIGCKFAYVEDPSLVDVAEGALINFFAFYGAAEWNRSGFGSKVTGYNRGRQVGSEWDAQYPPDLAWPVEAGAVQPVTLYSLVRQIARLAPITFSIPTTHRRAFNAAHTKPIQVPTMTRPFREWVMFIKRHLALGWDIEHQAGGWYIVPA